MELARVMLMPGVMIAIIICASSCARRTPVKSVPRAPSPVAVAVKPGDTEVGIASWYGDPYHGRRAANGEVYDMNEMTAAHRTMPFGTWVRVEHLVNGKKTEVRITDRGPFIDGRIIDLSRKAAEEIALIGPGIGRVKLTVIPPPKGAIVESYGVQILATDDEARAREAEDKLGSTYGETRVVRREGDPVMYRLIVGNGTREVAEALRVKLLEKGYRGFVTRHVP